MASTLAIGHVEHASPDLLSLVARTRLADRARGAALRSVRLWDPCPRLSESHRLAPAQSWGWVPPRVRPGLYGPRL
jgi:hypothetical protein